MTAKYIAARLDTIDSDYPDHEIIVIAHSNGTRATKIAIVRSHSLRNKYPRFRIDKLILLGCVIKRNFDWNYYPFIRVINFVSTNDKIVFFARIFGMGRAGRYGFKIKAPNLKQIEVEWGHSGYLEHYTTIKREVRREIT